MTRKHIWVVADFSFFDLSLYSSPTYKGFLPNKAGAFKRMFKWLYMSKLYLLWFCKVITILVCGGVSNFRNESLKYLYIAFIWKESVSRPTQRIVNIFYNFMFWQVNLAFKQPGKRLEHQGIRIEFVGQIGEF